MATIAIIGAGPAGLMAADALVREGFEVNIYDQMTSVARKFLMAGKSGLNISHGEDTEQFLRRYNCTDPRMVEIVRSFGADDIRAFMDDLGIEHFTGPTGRIFPKAMKASPLLRAWLKQLQGNGTFVYTSHRWTGWDGSALRFDTPNGPIRAEADATILALGGASWSRLGSDGQWSNLLKERDIPLAPFRPSNCGFATSWSDHMIENQAGEPVKNVRMTTMTKNGPESSRGEFVITRRGIEGGGIYTLSADLVRTLQKEPATINIDLLPDLSEAKVAKNLARPRGTQSFANYLRKTIRLTGVKKALLNELGNREEFDDPKCLAAQIKALPLTLTAPFPMDEAISTAGGVRWQALDDHLMLKTLPGVFCAGEMLDWDAPTGGYLLTACLATGRHAGKGAANWLRETGCL